MNLTVSFEKKMQKLKQAGLLYDYELRNEVEERLLAIGEQITDEQATLFDQMQDTEDDDIYYGFVHCLAESLNIRR